jgi:hypothetical protein
MRCVPLPSTPAAAPAGAEHALFAPKQLTPCPPSHPGTIIALSNTFGVVGVAGQGARLHHYNAFGATDEAPDSEMFMGLVSCKAQLAALKKSNPGMRMVVSMSLVRSGSASAGSRKQQRPGAGQLHIGQWALLHAHPTASRPAPVGHRLQWDERQRQGQRQCAAGLGGEVVRGAGRAPLCRCRERGHSLIPRCGTGSAQASASCTARRRPVPGPGRSSRRRRPAASNAPPHAGMQATTAARPGTRPSSPWRPCSRACRGLPTPTTTTRQAATCLSSLRPARLQQGPVLWAFSETVPPEQRRLQRA